MDFGSIERYPQKLGFACSEEVAERIQQIVEKRKSTTSAVCRRLIKAGLEVYDQEEQPVEKSEDAAS